MFIYLFYALCESPCLGLLAEFCHGKAEGRGRDRGCVIGTTWSITKRYWMLFQFRKVKQFWLFYWGLEIFTEKLIHRPFTDDMVCFVSEIKMEINLQGILFKIVWFFVFLQGLSTFVSSSFFPSSNIKQFSCSLNSNWSKFKE